MNHYIPSKGDIVVLTFDPQTGHEQKGRRPAIVISNDLFNQKTGIAIACPITNTDRKIPFHIAIPDDCLIKGFIMVEQIKSIDYCSRKIKFVEKSSIKLINEVLSIVDVCIYS